MESELQQALSNILSQLDQLRQQQDDVTRIVGDRLERLEHLAVHYDGLQRHHRQSSFVSDHWPALGGMPDMLAFAAPASRAAAAPGINGPRAHPWLETQQAGDPLGHGSFCLKAFIPGDPYSEVQQGPDGVHLDPRAPGYRGHAYSSNDLYRTGMVGRRLSEPDSGEGQQQQEQPSGLPQHGSPAAVAAVAAAEDPVNGAVLPSEAAESVAGARRSCDDDVWELAAEEGEMSRWKRLRLTLYGFLWGLILPEQRAPWDLCIMLLTLWVVIATPIMVCFKSNELQTHLTPVEIIDCVVDIMFMFDIWFNFRTAYYNEQGRLVTNRYQVARRYVHTWFLVDVLSVLPFAAVLGHSGTNLITLVKLARLTRVGKVLQLLKGYRLLRVVRLPRLLAALEMKIDGGMARVVAGVVVVLLVIHLSGCLFFYMAVLAGPNVATWVTAEGLQNASIPVQYLSSIYWAATTLTTVGYGDVHPVGTKEKFLGMLVMVLGPFLAGYITSSIGTVMNIRNTTFTQVAAKKQRVLDFARQYSLPKPLALRLHNFFSFAAEKAVARDHAQLLGELPLRLRLRLLGQIYAGLVMGIPAFRAAPIEFLQQLVGLLEVHSFCKEDLVLLQGDPGGTMYFVASGKLEVRQYEYDPVVDPDSLWQLASSSEDLALHPYRLHGLLTPRSFFGAVSCVARRPWLATVVAVEGSQLYSISCERLQVLLSEWPVVAQAFYQTTVGPFWQSSEGGAQEHEPLEVPPLGPVGLNTASIAAAAVAAEKSKVAEVLRPPSSADAGGGKGGGAAAAAAAATGAPAAAPDVTHDSPVALHLRMLMWDFPMMVKVKHHRRKGTYGQILRAANAFLHVTGWSSLPASESPEPSAHHPFNHSHSSSSSNQPPLQGGWSDGGKKAGALAQLRYQEMAARSSGGAGGQATIQDSSKQTAAAATAGVGAGQPPAATALRMPLDGIKGGLLKVPSSKGLAALAAAAAAAEASQQSRVPLFVRRACSSPDLIQARQQQQQQQQQKGGGDNPPSSTVSRLANIARGMLSVRASSSRHVTTDLEEAAEPPSAAAAAAAPPAPVDDLAAPSATAGGAAAAAAATAALSLDASIQRTADLEAGALDMGPEATAGSATGLYFQSRGPSMYSSLGGESFQSRSQTSSWGGAGPEPPAAATAAAAASYSRRVSSRSRSMSGARPALPLDYLDGLISFPGGIPGGANSGPGELSPRSPSARPTLEEARMRFRQLADRSTTEDSRNSAGEEVYAGAAAGGVGSPRGLASSSYFTAVSAAGDRAELLDTALSGSTGLFNWPVERHFQLQQQRPQQQGLNSSLRSLHELLGGDSASTTSSRRVTNERRQDP